MAADHDPRCRCRRHPRPGQAGMVSPSPTSARSSSVTLRTSKTWNGWLYLATVIDCYTKMVVGYAMATHMETSLVRAAIDMAARNITLTKRHCDRGSVAAMFPSERHRRSVHP